MESKNLEKEAESRVILARPLHFIDEEAKERRGHIQGRTDKGSGSVSHDSPFSATFCYFLQTGRTRCPPLLDS